MKRKKLSILLALVWSSSGLLWASEIGTFFPAAGIAIRLYRENENIWADIERSEDNKTVYPSLRVVDEFDNKVTWPNIQDIVGEFDRRLTQEDIESRKLIAFFDATATNFVVRLQRKRSDKKIGVLGQLFEWWTSKSK